MKINNIGYLLKEGIRGIFLHGFMSVAAICVTVACLLIGGSFYCLMYNVNIMVDDLNKTNEVLVIIDETLSDAEAKSVGTQINQVENVYNATFKSREEALKDFIAEHQNEEAFSGVSAEDLRHRYIVVLEDNAKMRQTVAELERIPGVAKINAANELAEGFSTLQNVLRIATLAVASVLLFIAVTVIAGFYFCGDRRRIEQSLLSVLPASWRERIPPWRDRARQASFRYLRAYMLLLLLTFLELFVGLGLLRVDYAFLLAAVIAVVDLLPVLGVGTVLIPWAVGDLFNRRFSLGVGLLILYLAVSVLHQILEPKLVGKSLGLHPLLTLAAGYIGFRSFGILGMAAAPFAALLCKCFLARACRAEDGEGERG